MSDFNLGTVTAYGYAKDKGYTGTEDDFAALMASYADVAEQAAESAEQAAASATTATAKASEAAASATAAASSKTAAETAQGGAETAAQTATTKAGEASTAATTATNKATEATTAATTATGKATEAAGSATTATTKAGEASTSATNAAASATRAQEILDSIPEDYSQLSEDVSDLKDGLSDVEAQVTAALVTDTASGSIVSFPDGADGVPVKSLTVDIEPVQDLHGQANPYPAGGGKNLTPYDTPLNVSAGASVQPVLFTVTLESGVAYTFSCKQSVNIPTSERNTLMIKAPNGGNYYEAAVANYNPTNLRHVYTYTPSESGAHEVRMWDITPSVAVTYTEWQVEKGSAFTSYAPYSNICPISGHTSAVVTVSPTTDAQDGTSYTIDLDGTRYGGTFDATTGVLTVTDANIASYNGETLPSTWISDRDVYASGTTPTTGAQVVYKLATPTTVQLTAEEVTTLLGQNNIWNDCGNTEVEYRADTKLYIQKVINS